MALFVCREPRLLRGCDERHEFSATAVVTPASLSPLRKFRLADQRPLRARVGGRRACHRRPDQGRCFGGLLP